MIQDFYNWWNKPFFPLLSPDTLSRDCDYLCICEGFPDVSLCEEPLTLSPPRPWSNTGRLSNGCVNAPCLCAETIAENTQFWAGEAWFGRALYLWMNSHRQKNKTKTREQDTRQSAGQWSHDVTRPLCRRDSPQRSWSSCPRVDHDLRATEEKNLHVDGIAVF